MFGVVFSSRQTIVGWKTYRKSPDDMPDMVFSFEFWFHINASVVRCPSAAIFICSRVQVIFSASRFTSNQLSSYQPIMCRKKEEEKSWLFDRRKEKKNWILDSIKLHKDDNRPIQFKLDIHLKHNLFHLHSIDGEGNRVKKTSAKERKSIESIAFNNNNSEISHNDSTSEQFSWFLFSVCSSL